MGEVVLSRRLQALAQMVTPGGRVADVGCDHGFLSIYLVQHGLSPGGIAMDVRKGPLEGAKKHIAAYGLEDYITVRQSDGLDQYHAGEAQALVCAGMGGRLMMKILSRDREKSRSFRELVLQPQSVLPEFRIFLRREGFSTVQENILWEEGKFYFLFKTVPGEAETPAEPQLQRLFDKYGRRLLECRHPVLKQYLEKRLEKCREVESVLLERRRMDGISPGRERSLLENRGEEADLHRALAFFS